MEVLTIWSWFRAIRADVVHQESMLRVAVAITVFTMVWDALRLVYGKPSTNDVKMVLDLFQKFKRQEQ